MMPSCCLMVSVSQLPRRTKAAAASNSNGTRATQQVLTFLCNILHSNSEPTVRSPNPPPYPYPTADPATGRMKSVMWTPGSALAHPRQRNHPRPQITIPN